MPKIIPDGGEKAVSRPVSLFPSYWDKVEERAKAGFGGNRSLYFRKLLDQDFAGGAKTAAGSGSRAFAELRARVSAATIDRLLHAVADGKSFAKIVMDLTGGDPELMDLLRGSYDFLAGKEEQRYSDKMEEIVAKFAATLNDAGAREFLARNGLSLAAEDQAEYHTNPAGPHPKPPRQKKAE